MSNHDLVQRALRLLTHPIETGEAKAALTPQQGIDPVQKDSTVRPGDQITWPRADGSMHSGMVDYIHTDADGGSWAFVTIGESWAAVNLKFATVRPDVDLKRVSPMSPNQVIEWREGT